jgi:hypothetical protein
MLSSGEDLYVASHEAADSPDVDWHNWKLISEEEYVIAEVMHS